MSIARTRTIGLGLGLVFLAAVGASTLTRAQQPGEAQGPPKAKAPSRAELRERVVKLRSQVDLLQFDHDSIKAVLVEWGPRARFDHDKKFQSEFWQARSEFSDVLHRLHEAKFDLADAERQYQHTEAQ